MIPPSVLPAVLVLSTEGAPQSLSSSAAGSRSAFVCRLLLSESESRFSVTHERSVSLMGLDPSAPSADENKLNFKLKTPECSIFRFSFKIKACFYVAVTRTPHASAPGPEERGLLEVLVASAGSGSRTEPAEPLLRTICVSYSRSALTAGGW